MIRRLLLILVALLAFSVPLSGQESMPVPEATDPPSGPEQNAPESPRPAPDSIEGEGAPPATTGVIVEGQIRIETSPPGATVWINERVAGQTPIVLPADSIERVIRLRLSGFKDVVFPVRSSGATTMLVVLQSDDQVKIEEQPTGGAVANPMPPQADRAPSRRTAALLSFFLPGMGQAYQGRSWPAYLFGFGSGIAAMSYAYGDHLYRQGIDTYSQAYQERLLLSFIYTGSSFGASSASTASLLNSLVIIDYAYRRPTRSGEPSCNRELTGCALVHDGYDLREGALAVFALLWFGNMIDVLYNHPSAAIAGADPPAAGGRFYLSAVPVSDAKGRPGFATGFGYRLHF